MILPMIPLSILDLGVNDGDDVGLGAQSIRLNIVLPDKGAPDLLLILQ